MPRRTTTPLTGFATIMAILALGSAVRGQVVRLHSQITVEPRQDVRLGDLATIHDPDAARGERLSNTMILTGIDGPRKVSVESILLALIAQRGAAAVSGLQISGAAACQVNLTAPPPAAPDPVAPPPATTVAPADPQRAALNSITTAAAKTAPADPADRGNTLTAIINAKVQQDLGVTADDMRIGFDTISPLLESPLPPGRQWLCRPLTRPLLGTVQFEAQLVEGTRVINRLIVSTKVERRIMVITTLAKLGRGDTVTPDMVHVEEAWVDRKVPSLFSQTRDVLGLEAQRDIDIGSRLDQRDFKPAVMAARGDALTVIYLSGALKVQMRGRAMGDGKLHDNIDVRNESTGERYQATLIGKHLAVVGGTLDPALEKQLRESQ